MMRIRVDWATRGMREFMREKEENVQEVGGSSVCNTLSTTTTSTTITTCILQTPSYWRIQGITSRAEVGL